MFPKIIPHKDQLPYHDCPSVDSEQQKMLADENHRLRKAGTELAQAALRVIVDYDGLHRLALAVGEWSKALADQHGRGEKS